MSSGIMRPALFVAVLALGASGYYGFTQSKKVEDYRAAHATLKAERDGLLAKNDQLGRDAAMAKKAQMEAEAKVAALEAAPAAKKTAAR